MTAPHERPKLDPVRRALSIVLVGLLALVGVIGYYNVHNAQNTSTILHRLEHNDQARTALTEKVRAYAQHTACIDQYASEWRSRLWELLVAFDARNRVAASRIVREGLPFLPGKDGLTVTQRVCDPILIRKRLALPVRPIETTTTTKGN